MQTIQLMLNREMITTYSKIHTNALTDCGQNVVSECYTGWYAHKVTIWF
jgi:hypothetical protein